MSVTNKGPDNRQERMERRRKAAADALRALIRDCYAQRFGPCTNGEPWELDLKVTVDPSKDWALSFDPPLVDQLLPQMEGIEAGRDVFHKGRVYCFRCGDSLCDHAVPDSQLQVFQGFDELGCPLWQDFSQQLLDAGDERIGLLYNDQRKVVTRFSAGSELHQRQLASFGRASKTYALLGQVTAGYFSWRAPGQVSEDTRLAITFQAVELRDGQGRVSLELNLICHVPEKWELSDVLSEHFDWVLRARRQAHEALKKLEEKQGRTNRSAPGWRKQVVDVLRRLSSTLERGQRQADRQTRHARDRRKIRRPVDKAMADLSRARLEHMFLDRKTRAIVLCSDKGRCHIFNENGRHVTSFVIEPGSVELRLRKQRWCALEQSHYQRFLENIGGGSLPGSAG